jgi:alkylglycerol monooxygenase
MNSNPIVWSIPVFIVLIFIEILVDRVRGGADYRVNDAVTSISCGIGEQVTGVFLRVFVVALYEALYEKHALFSIPVNAGSWLALFLWVDFLYYWFHRLSHEVNLMWAGHVVHHQSEEYNLSTALRQSSTQKVFSFAFYLPLAVLGFSPNQFLMVYSLVILYQFWIHTRLIKRLGFFETFLNTPSHHRVHHGVNPKYLDKNHGGTLIVWDKLFGTFQAEEEEPVYGTTKASGSFNPLWLNAEVYAGLFGECLRVKGFRARLTRLFGRPGAGIAPVEVLSREKYDPACPVPLRIHVLIQFLVVLAGVSWFLNFHSRFTTLEKFGFAGFLIWSIVSLGAVLDRSRWAIASECLRVGALLTGVLLPLDFWVSQVSLMLGGFQ